MKAFGEVIRRGIIVSCQAKRQSPLRDSAVLARLAQAAELGGAVAIRADGPEDVACIRSLVRVPIVGIYKIEVVGSARTVITPTLEAATKVASAGADAIAVGATRSDRAFRELLAELVAGIHARLGLPVMADISDMDEGVDAVRAGADAVATTLSGYTPDGTIGQGDLYRPDLALVQRLVSDPRVAVPVVAEGRFWSREDVRRAFDLGVHGVVIGKAITNAQAITRYFTEVLGDLRSPVA